MICANCGGNINVDKNCEKCGISYDEMISSIRHDELIRILERIYKSLSANYGIDISLLACEIINASFLIPAEVRDDGIFVKSTKNRKGKRFILLFTDKDEYDKNESEVKPRTNPFREVMKLLDDECEGFVINVNSLACEVSRKFLDDFFGA